MLTISTQQYNQSLLSKLGTRHQRQPLSGIWELTHHCNLKCVHCYCEKTPGKNELSLNEAKNIINQIVEAGCLWLTFTGGEIFQRPDFPDIYTYAKSKGLIITLLTNGTLITESVVRHLVEHPPSLIEITLYGRTQETYEKITRANGSYEQCLKAIRLLRQYEIPFLLKTMLLTLNQHELW
ncbi:radical SAM protein, partial [Planctomycetota bacterium]